MTGTGGRPSVDEVLRVAAEAIEESANWSPREADAYLAMLADLRDALAETELSDHFVYKTASLRALLAPREGAE